MTEHGIDQLDIRTSTGAFGCKLHFFLTYYLSPISSCVLVYPLGNDQITSTTEYDQLICPVCLLVSFFRSFVSCFHCLLTLPCYLCCSSVASYLPVSRLRTPANFLYLCHVTRLLPASPTTSLICRRGRSSSSPWKELFTSHSQSPRRYERSNPLRGIEKMTISRDAMPVRYYSCRLVSVCLSVTNRSSVETLARIAVILEQRQSSTCPIQSIIRKFRYLQRLRYFPLNSVPIVIFELRKFLDGTSIVATFCQRIWT